jgi:hypothetical protein
MTVNTSGQSARARTLGARLTAGLGVVLLGCSLGIGSPAFAANETPTPTPAPTPEIPAGTTAFTLSPVGSGIVEPGDGLTVSVTLQNATAAPTPATDVTLELGSEAITDRRVLDEWLNGENTEIATAVVATETLEPVESESEVSKGMLVEADDPALDDLDPGVYPLVATYETDAEEVRSTSAMIVPGDDDLGAVGVIVPITGPTTATGLLTLEQLTELTAPGGALANQLAAVDGTPAILAIDPAIVAAIRVLGSRAPESAVEWLDRLIALPNDRFALQFGDADVSVQLATGLTRPVQPRALTAYMNPADFVGQAEEPEAEEQATASPTPTPTPDSETADDTAPRSLPELPELLDIGEAHPGIYWPAPDSLTADSLTTLGDIAVDDQASLVVMGSDDTGAGAAGATVGARARIDDAAALVYDSAVSTALHDGSLQGSPALRGADLTAASARLQLAGKDSRGAPLLVTVDRDADRSHVALRTAIMSAAGAPGFTAAGLTELTEAGARRAQVVEAEATPARTSAASALLNDEADLGRFATILDDTTLLTGPERAEILQLFAVSWVGDEADDLAWQGVVNTHRLETVDTLDSVGLLPSSTINLFGSGAGLGFWVRNDLPYPVNLVLYAIPDDLRLEVQRANPVLATAASNTRVEVPVQARVANGEVDLALQLRSPSSVGIGDTETVHVNVRAEWETVGIAALSIVVGGLLVTGVIRTILRRRAARAESDAADPKDPA